MVFLSAVLIHRGSNNSQRTGAEMTAKHIIGIMCLLLSVIHGAGFVVQALGTASLSEALGHPLRATMLCNIATIVCWIPLLVIMQQPLRVHLADWWLWLFVVGQYIFYISSLSVIPRFLS